MNDLDTAEFSAEQTHGFEKLSNFETHTTSAGLGWPAAYFSTQSAKPYSASFKGVASVLIGVVNNGYIHGDISIQNEVRTLQSQPGSIIIIADKTPFNIELRSSVNTTHLYIDRKEINRIASKIYNINYREFEIYNKLSVFDSVIESICKEIYRSICHDKTPLCSYIEYLVHAIAAHIIRNYSSLSCKRAEASPGGGLTRHLVDRTRDLIEERLAERLTVTDLAAGTGISADHFGRLFKQSVGVTLHQFVMRRRVERATFMLGETAKPIIQIAHECGFADQVHLTRVFGRMIGTTPAAFREERKK